MTKILKPQDGSDSVPDELLAEIAQLLAGPDGAAHKTVDGWTYSKPTPPPIDGGTVRPTNPTKKP